MYRQSRPMRPEEDQAPSSPGSPQPHSFPNYDVGNDCFSLDFSMDPTGLQQQCDLATSFATYAPTPPTDMTQLWEPPPPPQQYTDLPSPVPVHQELPPLVPRRSVTQSLVGDEGDDTSEPTSPLGDAAERRKERRRAQNRAAQRAFRARKEDTIKWSSARLEALQEELVRLESVNGTLSDTVSTLRSEIARLREENGALRSQRANRMIACEFVSKNEGYSKGSVGWVGPIPDERDRNVTSFGLNGIMIGTAQWPGHEGEEGERGEERSLTGAAKDAAAPLTRNVF